MIDLPEIRRQDAYEKRTREAVDRMESVAKSLIPCDKCGDKFFQKRGEKLCMHCIANPESQY